MVVTVSTAVSRCTAPLKTRVLRRCHNPLPADCTVHAYGVALTAATRAGVERGFSASSGRKGGVLAASAPFSCVGRLTGVRRPTSSWLLDGCRAFSSGKLGERAGPHRVAQQVRADLEAEHSDVAQRLFPSRMETSGLQAVFKPRSVAIIGATDREGAVGRTIVNNLLRGVQQMANTTGGAEPCKIFPVNPKRKEVLGAPCYSSLAAIPEAVDMAVIVTPASTCVDVMKQCAEKGVKAAVVISAGFKEVGPEGLALERALVETARDAGIRIIGPNCLGVMNPVFGLNATFAATMAPSGNLAFISQSGAMGTAVLDWSIKEKLGFSAFVSVGGMADVNWGDLIDYLGNDPTTSAILVYMEGPGNAADFLAAAREVAPVKPIIVIKAGKSDAAAAAAASHTGSLAGSHKSFEAAMRQVGITTVDTIQELFNAALILGKQPAPRGPNLMIMTNAGGPAVLATDAAVGAGAALAPLSAETKERLNKVLPAAWSHSNPVDILGDAPPALFAKALDIVLEAPEADGVLVALSPQDVTDPTSTARELIESVKVYRKRIESTGKAPIPILAAWMGGETVAEGARLLSQAGIPAFSNPDDAAATFGKLWKQAEAMDALYGTPEVALSPSDVLEVESDQQEVVCPQKRRAACRAILNKVRMDGRKLLTEAESKQILGAYGIPTVPTVVATTVQEAQAAAQKMGRPLYAVKLNSKTLTHKADVGGVHLNVKADNVAAAFEEIRKSVVALHGAEHFQGVTVQPMIPLDKGIELILGSTTDPQFGPLVMFGSGGTMVEIFKDTTLALPPLDSNISEMLLKRTKIYKALKGAQGKRFEGVPLDDLQRIMIRFATLITDLSADIVECDINPLLATKEKELVALDARIALRESADETGGAATGATTAFRSYPFEYMVNNLPLPTESPEGRVTVTLRPTVPADWSSVSDFFASLPSHNAERRFLSRRADQKAKEPLSLLQKIKMCYANYDRLLTFLAVDEASQKVVGVCELEHPPFNHLNSEVGHVRWTSGIQGRPHTESALTEAVLQHMQKVARQEGLKSLRMFAAQEDEALQNTLQTLGWESRPLDLSERDSLPRSVLPTASFELTL